MLLLICNIFHCWESSYDMLCDSEFIFIINFMLWIEVVNNTVVGFFARIQFIIVLVIQCTKPFTSIHSLPPMSPVFLLPSPLPN